MVRTKEGYEAVSETELTENPLHPKGIERFAELRFVDTKGKDFQLKDVGQGITILELKRLVEEECGAAIHLQRLIYSGKLLSNDDATLTSYKIADRTTIHLARRPENVIQEFSHIPPDEENDATTQEQNPPFAPPMVEMPPHFQQRTLSIADLELRNSRRRVKLLATLLLIISAMNVVSNLVELINLCFGGTKTEFLEVGLGFLVNSLGVYIGLLGVRASLTLNPTAIRNYCIGLALIGLIYIANDVYGVVHVSSLANLEDDNTLPPEPVPSDDTVTDGDDSSGGDNGVSDDAMKYNDDESGVTPAIISLILSICIWSICFYRAFAFRRAVHNSTPVNESIVPPQQIV